MANFGKDQQARLAAELLAVRFMALIVKSADALKIPYLLFPELAALLNRRSPEAVGKWAKEPCKLIVTPVMTAAIGALIAFIMLRVGRLRLPSALANGIIPFVLPSPTLTYAYAVGIGTVGLTLWFLASSKLQRFIAARWKLPPSPSL